MVDVIEATFNIRVKHIFALIAYIVENRCNRIVSTASRSETIAVGFKQGFPLGFEGLVGYCLTCPIDHHGYAERPLLSFSWLWYPDPSERLRFLLFHPFRVNGVNSDEKLPKSAEIKIPRVGNSMLAQASASQTFPDQVFLETLPSFLRDLQVIIPDGNWGWPLSLCFAGGGAGFQRLRGQVMEHPGLALLMQTITLPSNINRRRVMQQAVQHGSGQDIIRHHVTPFAIGFITGQDDAAFLIAAADQTKEKLR